MYAKITGTGSYLPEQIMTNEDWEKKVATTSQWIIERTGINKRHFANSEETASFMGAKAAQKALEMSNIAAKEIDMIVVATGTPDKIFPSTACLIQQKLKIPTCIAFDLQAACTGFIYALSVVEKFINSGAVNNALVVCTEQMSRLIDFSDRKTCVLFGDGAGAVVVSKSDKPGILETNLYADGSYSELLTVDNMQLADFTNTIDSLNPTENLNKNLQELNPFVQMQGNKVFKIAVTKLGEMVENVRKKYSIDWLVPHQANIRIIQAMADKLNLSMEHVILTVSEHSNTSSASIPLALDYAVRENKIQPNQTILFEAFGGGLTWGSAVVKF